ncbi:MAG: cysteinyl-tRNA synthetase [Gammaproteobacteria bacterium]|nr:MAG: cysteinyl-tRNA synthetase [Gammaproteobacteria bacterium]TND07373.1 MAG: cysteinyl-tRNA synthetase [Gammaproteobacteria bacterium]
MLQIYNSLTRQKEKFERPDRKVDIYVCGMTVYDYCHLGHARVMVVFDVIVRYLRATGLEVNYVRNITDIDDKIIRRARENDEDIDVLTGRYIAAMHEDEQALGVLPPDHEPRATDSMDAITTMIATLIDKGFAYQAGNGDVYYDVSRFENYGKLSNKRMADLRAGSRVEIDEAKDDPLDFVLWKAARPGEPAWDSAWGKGRPGWHIECSAMSTTCLGNHFDIHGGGMDLKFPHHENEIAQSEAATGEKFVDVWIHNGFVQINEEKMSKSLGNFFTVRDVLARVDKDDGQRAGEIIRYFILQSHYRSPLNYSLDLLASAEKRLAGLYRALYRAGQEGVSAAAAGDTAYDRSFRAAMDDDFNTSDALAVLDGIAGEINRALDDKATDRAAVLVMTLKELGGLLGSLADNPEIFLKYMSRTKSVAIPQAVLNFNSREVTVDVLVSIRDKARREKDWKTSDEVRDALKAQGYVVEDGADGTRVRKA